MIESIAFWNFINEIKPIELTLPAGTSKLSHKIPQIFKSIFFQEEIYCRCKFSKQIKLQISFSKAKSCAND